MQNNQFKGPVRVYPGRLSVSRTFGDIEAKLTKLGGVPGVIVAEPDIKGFKVSKEFDCIVMGCDGIFDKMSNKEIIDLVWASAKESTTGGDLHLECANLVERLLRESVKKKTLDNITCIIISFKNLKRMVEYFHSGKLEPV
jgi:protein phosphatase 2C family protein 2/3